MSQIETGTAAVVPTNFIRQIVERDLSSGRVKQVVTRFPPEPNGYLHIGHAKSICLNFGLARDFDGHCHLRLDDTNPLKETEEYTESIKRDVRWLGFDWNGHLYHASDYFDQLYEWAIELIREGLAYVDSQTAEQIRANRGTLTEPGLDSPFRNRSVEENLALFERMKNGELKEGECVLRAKINMRSPNLNLRDPVLYRIRHARHHRTGDKWCIYPLYDFTHGQSDAIEGVTHSLCTLEFEDHRALYEWFLEHLSVPCQPRQYEFSRLNLDFTVMSKRLLNALVDEGYVSGWDDPRMPTIAGMRRRGFTPAAIRDFCERIGVTKQDNRIELGLLENCVRDDLNRSAPRAMAVLRPLRVVLHNYPVDQVEHFEAPCHPKDPSFGSRQVPLSRVIYIDRDDFLEEPPRKFFRLAPGREVKLRNTYVIRCDEVIKDDLGNIIELRASYDPASRDRTVKGVIHWVSAAHAIPAEIRLCDRLFGVPDPNSREFREQLNAASMETITTALVEPSLAEAVAEQRVQFERLGYFCVDNVDSRPGALIFNRTVTLRDTWAKLGQQH